MAGKFKTGLSNLHYAVLDENTGVYGTPKKLAEAISASISREADTVYAYGDNTIIASARGAEVCSIGLETAKIPSDVIVELLGATKDENGVVRFSQNDVPRKVALMFEAQLDGGEVAKFVFYEGTFAVEGDEFSTKTDSVEFTGDSITGTFIESSSDAINPSRVYAMVRSDDTGVTPATLDGWYTAVYGATATV
jgi:phi13 family phage major tail protein